MIENCKEQILDDVVRVDLVLASLCDFDVPFKVRAVTMAGTKTVSGETIDRVGAAGLSLAFMVKDGDDGEIDSAPSLRQTEKQQAAGIVVSHDLQVPVTAGFEATRIAVEGLQTRHFHVVLTTQDGMRYLLYSLPGTSLLLLDEQDANQRATVKMTLQSMSHVIRLV
jgi:hypothetical protein